ncbi:hypothetical protein ACN3XK_72500 [Actinomadura welshii]
MTTGHTSSPRPPLLALLVPLLGLLVGWACSTCGGGGVASDGATCPDCTGHGHT